MFTLAVVHVDWVLTFLVDGRDANTKSASSSLVDHDTLVKVKVLLVALYGELYFTADGKVEQLGCLIPVVYGELKKLNAPFIYY